MFLWGLSANFLPYLLVLFVSLLCYFDSGTKKTIKVVQKTSVERPIAWERTEKSDITNISRAKDVEVKKTPNLAPSSTGIETIGLRIPVFYHFCNGPHRAPPAIFSAIFFSGFPIFFWL